MFRINPASGMLTLVERLPSGGKTPRHFALDPSGKWLWVANQDSNDLKLFQINPGSGRLLPQSGTLEIVSPVCVCFSSPIRPKPDRARDRGEKLAAGGRAPKFVFRKIQSLCI